MWFHDRVKLIEKLEQVEAKFWHSSLQLLQESGRYQIALAQQQGVYGYTWEEFPVNSFNRIMGAGKFQSIEQVLTGLIDNSQVPISISVPPLSTSPFVEIVEAYDLYLDQFESVYMTRLDHYDLDTYSTNHDITSISRNDLDQIIDMYLEVIIPDHIPEKMASPLVKQYLTCLLDHDQVYFYKISTDHKIQAIGAIYCDLETATGYIFNDITRKSFRNQGMQTDLIIHRGLTHELEDIFATIPAQSYTSSVGNAIRLEAEHLYDRSLFVYDPDLYS